MGISALITSAILCIFKLRRSLFHTLTFHTLTWSDWHPLSEENITLSLSYLVPEILVCKFGLIFQQMYYLTDFNFPLDFRSNGPPFHWFQIFLTPHFHKTLDLIGSNFFLHLEPGYRKFDKVPSSPPPWVLD